MIKFSKKQVPADVKKRIKKRHPDAGAKEFRQFMAVFEGSKDKGESDARAYAKAWGVLNQNKKLKDSHEKTNKSETKKNVNKWEKKHKWKNKKSSIDYELKKLFSAIEILGEKNILHNILKISQELNEPKEWDEDWHEENI